MSVHFFEEVITTRRPLERLQVSHPTPSGSADSFRTNMVTSTVRPLQCVHHGRDSDQFFSAIVSRPFQAYENGSTSCRNSSMIKWQNLHLPALGPTLCISVKIVVLEVSGDTGGFVQWFQNVLLRGSVVPGLRLSGLRVFTGECDSLAPFRHSWQLQLEIIETAFQVGPLQ